MMEMIPNWLVSNWDKFSIWVTNQPMFVEVAFGVGLFYVVLQIVRIFYMLLAFLFTGLFTGPRRLKKKKKKPTQTSGTKPITMDDDAPPFVFR
ncbi:MAG: hypothetical protein V2I56_25220 [Desulfobacteraceae bacterium]|jgi:hypothetical protein|nr:hypothetical protein [Desulfobacteraceae bacterium]